MNRNGWIVRSLFAGAALFVLLLFGCGDDDPPAEPANHNPVIDSVAVEPDTTVRGDTVTVTVSAHDPDGDSLRYNYSANNGSLAGSGSVITWTAPDAVGDFSLLASVTDGRSGVDSWTAILTVIDYPTGILGSASVLAGTETLVGAKLFLYTDPNDWPDHPYYEEIVPEDSPRAYTFTISPLPPGTYYLEIWKDLNGNQTIDGQDLYGFYGEGSLPDPEFSPIPVIQNKMTNIGSLNIS